MPRKNPVAAPQSLDPGRYVTLPVLGAFVFPDASPASANRRMQRAARPATINGVRVRMPVRHIGVHCEARVCDWEDYQRQCDEAKFGAPAGSGPAGAPQSRQAERFARDKAEALAACGAPAEGASDS